MCVSDSRWERRGGETAPGEHQEAERGGGAAGEGAEPAADRLRGAAGEEQERPGCSGQLLQVNTDTPLYRQRELLLSTSSHTPEVILHFTSHCIISWLPEETVQTKYF